MEVEKKVSELEDERLHVLSKLKELERMGSKRPMVDEGGRWNESEQGVPGLAAPEAGEKDLTVRGAATRSTRATRASLTARATENPSGKSGPSQRLETEPGPTTSQDDAELGLTLRDCDPQQKLNELLLACENEVREARGYVIEDTDPIKVARCKYGEEVPAHGTYLSRPKETGVDFTVPVEISGYDKMIKNPVTLNQIRTRCRTGQYKKYEDYLEDMRLLARNTRKFNTAPEAQWIVQHADLLLEAAEDAVQRRKRNLVQAEEEMLSMSANPTLSAVAVPVGTKRKREQSGKETATEVVTLGAMIDVFWDDTHRWYSAKVVGIEPDGRVSLHYEADDYAHTINLSRTKWRKHSAVMATMEHVEDLRGEILSKLANMKDSVLDEVQIFVTRLEGNLSGKQMVNPVSTAIRRIHEKLEDAMDIHKIEMQALRERVLNDPALKKKEVEGDRGSGDDGNVQDKVIEEPTQHGRMSIDGLISADDSEVSKPLLCHSRHFLPDGQPRGHEEARAVPDHPEVDALPMKCTDEPGNEEHGREANDCDEPGKCQKEDEREFDENGKFESNEQILCGQETEVHDTGTSDYDGPLDNNRQGMEFEKEKNVNSRGTRQTMEGEAPLPVAEKLGAGARLARIMEPSLRGSIEDTRMSTSNGFEHPMPTSAHATQETPRPVAETTSQSLPDPRSAQGDAGDHEPSSRAQMACPNEESEGAAADQRTRRGITSVASLIE